MTHPAGRSAGGSAASSSAARRPSRMLSSRVDTASADAVGLPVLAGPVEATAIGNVLVQARALGVDLPDLGAMRDLVRRTQPLRRHDPAAGPARR